MASDCGTCIAKYVLCLLNFVFFLCGSAILAVGIWLAIEKQSLISLLKIVPKEYITDFTQPMVIEQASYLLIATGGFMFIVSFLGYCGALRESMCCLTLYGICLIIILVLEITAGGLAIAYKQKAANETRTFLKSTLNNYYSGGNHTDAVTLMWNHLQAQLKCCGVDSHEDFANTAWANYSADKVIPESCCVLKDFVTLKAESPTCTTSPNDVNSYYKKGCFNAIMTWIMSHMNIIVLTSVSIVLLELMCVFMSFCLCKSVQGYFAKY